MKKKRKRIFAFLFILLISSFVLLINDTVWRQNDKKIYNISVITREKDSESSMIVRQGMDQAASEMNVEIRFVTLSENYSVEEQTKLVEREIKNNADAIIISPVDYEKMVEPIEGAMKNIPVIMIESTIKSDKVLPSISCNNYKLGVSLGEAVVKNGNNSSKVAIIKDHLECSSIKERYDGFMSVMNSTKNKCIFWELSDPDDMKNLLKNNDVDVVVTFDASELEWVSEAKKYFGSIDKKKASIQVYGTGSTSKIISSVEDNVINATAIQNEFNIGYLGVKAAVSKINGKDVESSTIYSNVINKDNMYSEENQRLLFPFVR